MGFKFDTANCIKFGDLRATDTFIFDHMIYMKTTNYNFSNACNLFSGGLLVMSDNTLVEPVNIFAKVERI